jgi:hypothetical protein
MICLAISITAQTTDLGHDGDITVLRLLDTTPWSSTDAIRYQPLGRRLSAIVLTATGSGQSSIYPRLTENRRAPFGVGLR